MICNDCLHYEACRDWDEDGYILDGMVECRNFKDKSRFVELPCKVGDKFYAPIRGEVCEFECTGFMLIRKTILLIDEHNRAFSFNQDAFLTKEEAEKALEEKKRTDENYLDIKM